MPETGYAVIATRCREFVTPLLPRAQTITSVSLSHGGTFGSAHSVSWDGMTARILMALAVFA